MALQETKQQLRIEILKNEWLSSSFCIPDIGKLTFPRGFPELVHFLLHKIEFMPRFMDSALPVAKELAQGFLHVLFPNRCWGCEQFLDPVTLPFCASCQTSLTADSATA